MRPPNADYNPPLSTWLKRLIPIVNLLDTT